MMNKQIVKKKICLLVLSALILTLFSSIVSAVSITPAIIKLDFEPGLEKTYTFTTDPGANLAVSIEGDLTDYLTIESNDIATTGKFTVKMSLPDTIEKPGENKAFIRLMEKNDATGMVSGIASIRTPIIVVVPFNGVYAEFNLRAPNVNINETSNILLGVSNKGTEPIKKLTSTIIIEDKDAKRVDAMSGEPISVNPASDNFVTVVFNASKHTAGTYNARAKITYDGNEKEIADSFRIGTLTIDILDYTKAMYQNKVDKFFLKIKSEWNDKISNIYADVIIKNETGTVSSFRTVTFVLEPWEEKRVESFFDPTVLGVGRYDMEINLQYQGVTQKETATFEIAKEPEVQQPFQLASIMNMTTLLVVAVILLILLNIVILLRKKRE